jgi:hypothetical protein
MDSAEFCGSRDFLVRSITTLVKTLDEDRERQGVMLIFFPQRLREERSGKILGDPDRHQPANHLPFPSLGRPGVRTPNPLCCFRSGGTSSKCDQ